MGISRVRRRGYDAEKFRGDKCRDAFAATPRLRRGEVRGESAELGSRRRRGYDAESPRRRARGIPRRRVRGDAAATTWRVRGVGFAAPSQLRARTTYADDGPHLGKSAEGSTDSPHITTIFTTTPQETKLPAVGGVRLDGPELVELQPRRAVVRDGLADDRHLALAHARAPAPDARPDDLCAQRVGDAAGPQSWRVRGRVAATLRRRDVVRGRPRDPAVDSRAADRRASARGRAPEASRRYCSTGRPRGTAAPAAPPSS